MNETNRAKENIKMAEYLLSRDPLELLQLIRKAPTPNIQSVLVTAYKEVCRNLLNAALGPNPRSEP